MLKKIFLALVVLAVLALGSAYYLFEYIKTTLPPIQSLKDYKPLLVSQVYDRNNKKIGEFYNERRVLIPYERIPKNLVHAFLAAEDSQFFEHQGVNYFAITRAFLANLKAGQTVQGGSTITQQVAKTLLLSSEKTYTRKIKELILSHRMEEFLSKEEILYLYLNQIFFGNKAYGVAMAAETYFRKPIEKLTLAEMAILAGLPKAPSAYSPVRNPSRAKERQVYVLNRMAEVGYITKDEAIKAASEPLKVYLRENFEELAPHYLETVRQMLVSQLGDEVVLNKGLKIQTSLDLAMQTAAQQSAIDGLKGLDKRQGYRGATNNITDPKAVGEFLLTTRNDLIQEIRPERIILPNGQFQDDGPLNLSWDLKKQGLPFYLSLNKAVPGIVSKVDDKLGLVWIRVAEIEGLIDIDTMKWARKPNPEKRYDLDTISSPSQALKMGDVILVKAVGAKFTLPDRILKPLLGKNKKPTEPLALDGSKYATFELDQEPLAEAALVSLDQHSDDVLAMVGGQDFEKSKFNRAIQAARQTGSSFKAFVYAAALDKGYTPATPIMDAPIVYEEEGAKEDAEGQGEAKTWKPSNHSKSFGGDIILRNALVKSLNVPSVKIIEDITVPYATDYARRLGLYSALNPDFTLVLGSSSVTLYEMTKGFAVFGRMGKRVRPILIKKVLEPSGKILIENLSLDLRFENEIRPIEDDFTKRRQAFLDYKTSVQGTLTDADLKKIDPAIFFENENQLISPQTAYLMTSLLKAAVEDKQGTGQRAKALGREVAGKTGSTNGYFDAWFIGFTEQMATGVWVGFDQEKSLGKGEVGGRAALPIWVDYMKSAHEGLPLMTFPVPDGIVFANIDADSGELASSQSKEILRQAFKEGTEPKTGKSQKDEDTDFYKQDLSE